MRQNINGIKAHNARFARREESFKLGLNEFSDHTQEEYNKLLGYKGKQGSYSSTDSIVSYIINGVQIVSNKANNNRGPSVDPAEESSVDLRLHKCCSPIYNQGQCGSCYAFSALDVFDINECLKCNRASPLHSSVQNIISCSKDDGNFGCNGKFCSSQRNEKLH